MSICQSDPNSPIIAIQPLETNTGVKNVLTKKWRVFIVKQNVESGGSLLKNRGVLLF